jgi:sRNA-binding regulator protein Hfq
MYYNQTLQYHYLSHLIKQKVPIALYLKNGNKLTGILMGMTEKFLFFKDGLTEYIDKQSVNAVLPMAAQAA